MAGTIAQGDRRSRDQRSVAALCYNTLGDRVVCVPPIPWSRLVLQVESPSEKIANDAGKLRGGFHSDPADQITRITGATLLTRDRRILTDAGACRLNTVAA